MVEAGSASAAADDDDDDEPVMHAPTPSISFVDWQVSDNSSLSNIKRGVPQSRAVCKMASDRFSKSAYEETIRETEKRRQVGSQPFFLLTLLELFGIFDVHLVWVSHQTIRLLAFDPGLDHKVAGLERI